jgi:hypothetical protein
LGTNWRRKQEKEDLEIIYSRICNTILKENRDDEQIYFGKNEKHENKQICTLILILRNEFEARNNAVVEFRVEFRSFIISSQGAIPGNISNAFKSLIDKCPTSVTNLWMKRMVCDVLKGSWMIWIGGKESVYTMMRPRMTLEKLEKRDVKYAQEGSVET